MAVAAAAPSDKNYFRVGVIHTGVSGGGTSYAPTTPVRLRSAPVDYWALGHVHKFQVLESEPPIVYCGTPQGRDINEQGRGGCVLVSVDGSGRASLKFCETGVFRFESATLTLGAEAGAAALTDGARKLAAELAGDGRTEWLLRLTLTGRTAFNAELRRQNPAELHELLSRALATHPLWNRC